MPAGHWTQVDDPGAAEYVPGKQLVHAVWLVTPGLRDDVPTGHAMQSSIDKGLLTLAYLPAGHWEHATLPEPVVENEPTGHCSHTTALVAPLPPYE